MNEHNPLEPIVNELIKEQEERGGVQVSKQVKGTRLEVQTHNTLYKLNLTNPETGDAIGEGGKFLPEPKNVRILGSGWFGGALLKPDWIGYQMSLCLQYTRDNGEEGCITTSTIQGVKIIGANFEYEMEWVNNEEDER